MTYAAEFGWDTTFEALVARIVADYAADHNPTREAVWIAELDDRRVGCVFCVAADDSTAQLRILLVDPSARGHKLGARLVDECVAFARRAGYARLRLWTNDPLVAARSVYLSRGFSLVEEETHHSFGVDLVGQVYELDLESALRRRQTFRLQRPFTADQPCSTAQTVAVGALLVAPVLGSTVPTALWPT